MLSESTQKSKRDDCFPLDWAVSGFVRAHGGSDIRDVNQNSENWAVVKAALVAGMYPNLAHVDQETDLLSSSTKKKLHFHPTSVLNQAQLKEVEQSVHPYVAGNTALSFHRYCPRYSAGLYLIL